MKRHGIETPVHNSIWIPVVIKFDAVQPILIIPEGEEGKNIVFRVRKHGF